MKYKTGYAAIVGRPNSGKSTLLNSLTGEKVSIISPKPQTTRNVLRGIYTDDQSQVIFVDTPGIYKAANKLGEIMVKNAEEAFGNTDVIIYIADASRKDLPGGEEYIISLLKNTKKPVILALNKIDKLSSKTVILKTIDELSKKVDLTEVIPVSALNNDGTALILESVKKLLPEGEKLYPDDMYTDQTERFIVSEIIREKLFNELKEEIPYGTQTEVVSFKEKTDPDIIEISVNIYCEKKSHKAIIIGKNGAMLKKIGTRSRIEIERILGIKVFLELWVKVKDEWRNDIPFLKDMGFDLKGNRS